MSEESAGVGEQLPDPVGVGPHPRPWPPDDRLDPDLLAGGDTRNVVDRYRYWRHDAIVADLDSRRHDVHVAIENWQHDFNIGSVVRTANAFLAAEVHIVGRRRWNRRGAMVTDRYQHVRHHPTIDDLASWAVSEGLPLLGIDNLPGSVPLETYVLPQRCVLVFGQEGPGLSTAARDACATTLSIAQFGSTRSINAGAAAAIALHAWVRAHAVSNALDAFYRRYNDLCNAHRFDELGEFVAADVEVNGERVGLAAYIDGLQDVVRAFPDYRWELQHLLVDGDWVSAHFEDTGTHRGTFLGAPATGRPVRTREFAMYRVADGKIAEVWVSADNLPLVSPGR